MGIRLVCCWPGLAKLWYRGDTRSLCWAILYSWTCCWLLLATFIWPQWVSSWGIVVLWAVMGVVWLVSLVISHFGLPRLIGLPDHKAGQLFQQAQVAYLRGQWFDAEALLLDVLSQFPRDAEALLLLVNVLRQSQRWSAALRRLDQLQLLETAAPWRFEIERERQLIAARIARARENN
ncbi:MAG: hypothetical protein KF752_18875 [Pirellulaceae bacterium]|nr:hypothetical protein [Pirellulaceae bacterium]